ncbi:MULTISPECIES: anti-sigma factor [unclassified Lysinibacillus]|uniref:anti-sigma factor n=1 Tax=unclassified Lysinibacillus TaxID=2636778 RepID=UPI00201277A8|nr:MULTISPECIES: anti-sigma factor [unclassified Lysinibacillus]MCL1696596.1 anti-sigma factor [Lysinibacillus sp. BPa_S21]MCL1698920.1 anti-sigma factor [Lysinibacillus sp. Bpr_S20]
MDDYEKLIASSKAEIANIKDQSKYQKAIKRTIFTSKSKLIFATLTVILLIAPISYMLTLMYYAFGTKSTTLMDVASQTLYVTEPNTSLEEIEFDMSFSPFSMKLAFDQYKRIGEEDYKANTYDLRFFLGSLSKKEVTTSLERVAPKHPTETNPWLIHPKNRNSELDTGREWRILGGLPDETVVEAYISFNDLMTVKEAKDTMPNVDVVWAAVDTGIDKTNLSKDGKVVSPIGYPVQPDNSTWSPFRDATSNEEVFKAILKTMEKHEELATAVSSAKNLALPERIAYMNKHGIKTYGVVVTGPKKEVLALEKLDIVRSLKVGEVKLWNWSR